MKNLNPLEQVLALFRPINTFLFLFLFLLLWVGIFELRNFWMERKKKRKEERERERGKKEYDPHSSCLCNEIFFLPEFLLAGRELLWSVVLYKLGITCPSFFSKRFAVEPQEFLREIEKKTTRIGEGVEGRKKKRKKKKLKKLRVKSRWKRLTFPSTWN